MMQNFVLKDLVSKGFIKQNIKKKPEEEMISIWQSYSLIIFNPSNEQKHSTLSRAAAGQV